MPERPDEQTAAELASLYEIGLALSSSRDPQGVVEGVLERALSVFDADYGSVMLLDPATDRLRIYAARGLDAAVVQGTEVARREGIVGAVMASGEARLLHKGEVAPDSLSGQSAEQARAAMCVPLKAKDQTIGVLNISRSREKGNFRPRSLPVLVTMGAQAAVALENARLVAQLQEKVASADRDLQEAYRELQVASTRMQAIVGSIRDGVIVTDTAGRVRFVNPAAAELLGIDPGSAEGKPFGEAAQSREAREVVERVLDEGTGQALGEFAVPGREPRFLRAIAAPLRDHMGMISGVAVVLSDITDLKELDQLKSDVVSFASHELRTPLASLKGIAATLQADEQAMAEHTRHELLDMMSSECDRLLRIVTQFLDVSKLDAGRALDLYFQTVDLRALIERVVNSQRTYAHGNQFHVNIVERVGTLIADADKLEQIIGNLLTNAIKYSQSASNIWVDAWAEGDYVCVSVKDEGMGIAPEDLPYIFDRYRRSSREDARRKTGHGIGLFLTKGLVETHGGTIIVESELDKGSVFTVRLPIAGPPEGGPPG